MRKPLNFLLSISSLATALTISTFLGSSCSIKTNSTNESIVTDSEIKENENEFNEKEENGNSKVNPNRKPNDNSDSLSINTSSIDLVNKGKMLPSQYLVINDNEKTNLEISKNLIIENFNNPNKLYINYKVISLDDSIGFLSIEMNYIENNIEKIFIFNFHNLLSVNGNQIFNLQFTQTEESKLLDLPSILDSKKLFNGDAKNLIKSLGEKGINFNIYLNMNLIPLDYIEFGEIDISGFNESWFTSSNDISINLEIKSSKIFFYIKEESGTSFIKKSLALPTNINKKFSLKFNSALDYYLSKITANNDYQGDEDKYAEYYYYDLNYNRENNISNHKLGNSGWLSNVKNEIEYNGKKYFYRPIYTSDFQSSIEDNGSLNINIMMCIENNDNTSKFSRTYKTINLDFFKKHLNDVFRSNNESSKDKFWLRSDASYYDDNINKLKKYSNKIKKEIEISNEGQVKLFNVVPQNILKSITNSFELMFSNNKLYEKYINLEKYYSNDEIAIESYYLDDFYLSYDKENDVFMINFKLNIFSQGIKSSNESNYMAVIITKVNASLKNL